MKKKIRAGPLCRKKTFVAFTTVDYDDFFYEALKISVRNYENNLVKRS